MVCREPIWATECCSRDRDHSQAYFTAAKTLVLVGKAQIQVNRILMDPRNCRERG
jgi:hypothetical protein